MKIPCVYIMARKKNGTLYIGVTSNLHQRVWQHKNDAVDGFCKKYGCKTLVWYERHDTMEGAIHKEKQMKEWKREWKINKIHEINPEWIDLYEKL